MAAGSLAGAMTELARRFEQHSGQGVRLVLGPSGMLRDRIVAGEAADLFASANMPHPELLRGSGKAVAVEAFARIAPCALATPDFALRDATLHKRLLDGDVRVATTTPRAGPAGDYAFEFKVIVLRAIDSRPLDTHAGPLALRSMADLRPGPRRVRNLCGVLVRVNRRCRPMGGPVPRAHVGRGRRTARQHTAHAGVSQLRDSCAKHTNRSLGRV